MNKLILIPFILSLGASAQSINGIPNQTVSHPTITAPGAGAADAPDGGGPFAAVANGLIALNSFYFTDNTRGLYAGSTYHSEGEYGADTILTMLAFPGHFTSSDFLNLVNKFIAAKATGSQSCTGSSTTLPAGDFPQTVVASGAAGQYCSGADTYGHYATGDGRIAVPLALYLYWQRTGDLTPYTANVAAIKTALAIPPRNGSNHLVTIVAGQEDIPGIGFLEQPRPLGDVADASVWYAWDDKAMAIMAAAAGDATNVTYFTNDFNNLTAGLAANLTDATSHLLLFANGAQMNVIDVTDSVLAIYPLLGQSAGILLSGTQATQISTWLNTNYSSLVNSSGYVKQVNSCTTVGIIPATGGAPYGTLGTTTSYQCGYWATFGGYFAYALGLNSPAQATTYLSTWLSSQLPTTEYYNQGSNTPQGDTILLTTGQSMRMANELFPTIQSISTGVCVANLYGQCTNSIPAGPSGQPLVTRTFVEQTTIASTITANFPHADSVYLTNLPTHDHMILGLGLAATGNNECYFGFYNGGGLGSADNAGTLGCNSADDILAWYSGNKHIGIDTPIGTPPVQTFLVNGDAGVSELVGVGTAPALNVTTGAASITTGSNNADGAVYVTSTGAFTIVMTFSGGYAYPNFPSCMFNPQNSNAPNVDWTKQVSSSTTTVTFTGIISAPPVFVNYLCSGY